MTGQRVRRTSSLFILLTIVLYYSYADVAQWQSTVFVKRALEVRFLSSAFKITYMESQPSVLLVLYLDCVTISTSTIIFLSRNLSIIVQDAPAVTACLQFFADAYALQLAGCENYAAPLTGVLLNF